MNNAAQLLGYPPDSKLLIIHADDLGMSHSINLATFTALEAGVVSSASVMVPCPWFAEVAEYAIQHRGRDIGVHLTFTSEWKHYRWGPVSKKQHRNLVDAIGYFWATSDLLRASSSDVQAEALAQIMVAKQAGISPTHIDSHMFSLFRPDLIETYINVGRQSGLPFFICPWSYGDSFLQNLLLDTEIPVDALFQVSAQISVSSWKDYYIGVLKRLEPGLNQLIVHLGFDDSELRAITMEREPWGAAWRQRDFDIVMSAAFKSTLLENDITVIDWATIKSLGPRG